MFSVSHAVLLASRSDKQKDPWIEIGSFKQFNVVLRFGNLISRDTPLRLCNYKAFILPNLNYCSSDPYRSFGVRVMLKTELDILNKGMLRFLFIKDYYSPYGNLLDIINLNPLYIRCLLIFLVILYESPFQ